MRQSMFDLQLFGETPAAGAGDPAGAAPPPAAGADSGASSITTPPAAADQAAANITTQPPAATATANIANQPPAAGEGDPPAAADPAAAEADPAAAIELKFDVPAGFDTPSEDFVKFAKDNNLTQEQAQGVVDFYAKTIVPQFQQTLDKQNAEWSATTMSEFGNEGVELAKTAFNQLATPELTKLLNDTGLGSHPEVVRLFNGIGKSISESKLILGKMNATKSDAQILFGDSVK